ANGTMPVIVGEYGNSTNGVDIDPNANHAINTVLNSGDGNVAWAWGTGNPGDGLITGNGGLSSYGQQVAAGIAKQAAASPSTPPTTPTPPTNPTPPSPHRNPHHRRRHPRHHRPRRRPMIPLSRQDPRRQSPTHQAISGRSPTAS